MNLYLNLNWVKNSAAVICDKDMVMLMAYEAHVFFT